MKLDLVLGCLSWEKELYSVSTWPFYYATHFRLQQLFKYKGCILRSGIPDDLQIIRVNKRDQNYDEIVLVR
jgi:hypothetical protein